jgi:hypothetical protein
MQCIVGQSSLVILPPENGGRQKIYYPWFNFNKKQENNKAE